MARNYPEHDKLNSLQGQDQDLVRFLEWLFEEFVVEPNPKRPRKFTRHPLVQGIVAEYCEIDLDVLEKERQKMQDHLARKTKPRGSCCHYEKRNMNGGCDTCGDPAL